MQRIAYVVVSHMKIIDLINVVTNVLVQAYLIYISDLYKQNNKCTIGFRNKQQCVTLATNPMMIMKEERMTWLCIWQTVHLIVVICGTDIPQLLTWVHPVFSGVHVTRSLSICVMFWSLFDRCLPFFFWPLSVLLQCTASDYFFSIFKHCFNSHF